MRRILAAIALLISMATLAMAQSRMSLTIATGVDPSLAQFYVAQAGGIFKKNGLNVDLKLGSSGSAMIPLLVNNQVQAALGGEQAGIQTFNLDPNVVAVSEAMLASRYLAIIGRNVPDLAAMKGKRIGVALGTVSEIFWQALVDKYKLNPKDYTIVNVETPEMLAAIDRHDVDVVVGWEPWSTRILGSVPGTKILKTNQGVYDLRDYVYVNRGWGKANPAALKAFMKSLVEATQLINDQPDEAAKYVAETLKLDDELTGRLMKECDFAMRLGPSSVDHMKIIEKGIQQSGKLAKPVDWQKFFWTEPLADVAPGSVVPLLK